MPWVSFWIFKGGPKFIFSHTPDGAGMAADAFGHIDDHGPADLVRVFGNSLSQVPLHSYQQVFFRQQLTHEISSFQTIYCYRNKLQVRPIKKQPPLKIQDRFKNFTVPANLDLFAPIFMDQSFTDGPVDKPASVAGFILPGRAMLFSLGRAFFNNPA
jgi:hypothetical protein